ncbi:MAG: hypothetical protein U1F42_10620 [Candidatus Competibacteraceae bacterium]
MNCGGLAIQKFPQPPFIKGRLDASGGGFIATVNISTTQIGFLYESINQGMVLLRYLLILFVTLLIGLAGDITVAGQVRFLTKTQYDARITMHLFVKLRDGFNNDTVTIRVNGKEVYRKSGVSTDLTISFADTVEVPVKESLVKLEVAVEGRQLETKEIRVQETPFVDVWIIGKKMELRESKEEVPML